jgi:hypothetical protein
MGHTIPCHTYHVCVCVCVCVCVFVIPLESRFQEGEQAWQSRCYVSQYHGIDEKVLCVKSVWEPKICRLERNERERERERESRCHRVLSAGIPERGG